MNPACQSMLRAVFLFVALIASPLLFSGAAAAESRVALVIGNGAYRSAPRLANPPNDARDVANALKSLDFDVTMGLDLDQAQMRAAIEKFGKAAATADVSLFYYGGHGLQVNARNYLLPTDAQLRSIEDIDKRTIHFDEILDPRWKGHGIHLIFLDACRNNPAKEASAVLTTSGLARMGDAAGYLIVFATQPDNVAFDGAGRNSPFAQALLNHMATRGVDVSSLMISVRNDVMATTGGAQVPWENSSLTRQFYFSGQSTLDNSPETSLWRLAGGQRDPDLLSVYLQRYPQGPHVEEVRSLLANIGATPSTDPATPSKEEDLWRLALSTRDGPLVDAYINRYPKGLHTREAEELRASVREADDHNKDPSVVCQKLATHPDDSTPALPGVALAVLQSHVDQAIEACQQAASAHPENPHLLALLARAYIASGRYDDAINLFRRAADAGDSRALYSLGVMTERGDHVAKDVKAAYRFYEKAAERGNADGAINLAVALWEGKVLDRNSQRAFALLKQAAETGSAKASFDLAELLNETPNSDSNQILDLFRRAAKLGEPSGYRAAAGLLDVGRQGLPRDASASADLLLHCVIVDKGTCLKELTGDVQNWSEDTVKAVQTRLKTAGYYSGPIDGHSGAALAPALRQWRLLGPPQKS